MVFERLDFLPLKAEDVPVLTPIMKRAFDDDARRHFGKPEGGPEGYDDGSFLRKWGLESGAEAYRIDHEGSPIGAMILFIDQKHAHGFLGCMFIDDHLIGHGYGSTAWRFAEHTHPEVKLWATETPAVCYRNHCFYINKCGFHVVAVEGGKGDGDRFEAQFKLQKRIAD